MEEEVSSLYHLGKIKKGSLESLRVAQDGRVGYRHNIAMATTNNLTRIEEEEVGFTDSRLNGRHDEHLQDTGQPFEPDDTHLEEFLSNLTQLSQDSQDALVMPLTEDEVKDVVKSCDNGKSLGLDGLTYKFYKCTWVVIGTSFSKVLQVQLTRVRLLESGRHGATRLIPIGGDSA